MAYKLIHQLTNDSEVAYTPYLYNTPEFLKANNDLPQIHYYWVNSSNQKVMAHVAFSLEEGEAISPVKAPFGGIEFAEELKEEELSTFLLFVERELKNRGVRFTRIYQPPENYINQEKLNSCLKDLQFSVKEERIYQGIKIESEPLELALMEQRRLRKCRKAGFKFKKINLNDLSKVFGYIESWRSTTNKPLSMKWPEFVEARKANRKSYLPFGVFDGDSLVAATIAIKVNNNVLYHFYPAHDPEYSNFSPMVMLVDGMYGWCQRQGIEILDLGTSYVNGKMNQSLFRFKSHIGGKESRALVFRKALSSR